MTDQNEEKKSAHIITNRFAVPSKGKTAEAFTTKRFSYEIQNIQDPPLIAVPDSAAMVLRAKALFRVFRQDRVDNDEKLAEFDALTPGLDLTIRELTHGTYLSKDKPLKMTLKGHGETRMPAYYCDPSRKDGSNALTHLFEMRQLLQAANGDERLDVIRRYNRSPLTGQRVGKSVTGSGDEAASDAAQMKFEGWVFSAAPSGPTVDYESMTATFNSFDELGFAVYVPLATIRFMLNLYTRREPIWRKVIEADHVIYDGRREQKAPPRRLTLAAGHQAPKEEKKAPAKKKGRGQKTPQVEAAPETPPADTSSAEVPSGTSAEA